MRPLVPMSEAIGPGRGTLSRMETKHQSCKDYESVTAGAAAVTTAPLRPLGPSAARQHDSDEADNRGKGRSQAWRTDEGLNLSHECVILDRRWDGPTMWARLDGFKG